MLSFVLPAGAGSLPASVFSTETSGLRMFGEAEVGLNAAFAKPASDLDTYVAPYVRLGGKLAIQSGASPFGLQMDLGYAGIDAAWISPAVHVDAAAHDGRANLHLTYLQSERLKLGWYAGLAYDVLSASDGDDDHETARGLSWRTGIAGLFVYTPQTTVFAHAGYVDPVWASLGGGDSVTDSSNIVWGVEAGVGVEHRFAPRWTLGFDADILHLRARGTDQSGDADVVDLAARLGYAPESIPGTVTVSAAWLPLSLDADDDGTFHRSAFNIGVKYAYRFGVPATSAETTLLRTGFGR